MKRFEVTIHVFDENRKSNKDFLCDRTLLSQEMKYFQTYLQEADSEPVDISVHCDVNIFDWLLKYIKNKNEPPALTTRNVVSVMISSNFLQMENLVIECLNFFKQNCAEVLKVPIDLSCIPTQLIKNLSPMFTLQELLEVEVDDPKDKLISLIYLHKLDALLSQEGCISRCLLCGILYSGGSHRLLTCEKANLSVGVLGEFKTLHVPSKKFKMKKYLLALRKNGSNWKDIFWHVWGLNQIFSCVSCKVYFSSTYTLSCRFHKDGGVSDEIIRNYSCCATMVTGSCLDSVSGCSMRPHVPDLTKQSTHDIYDLVKKLFSVVLVPRILKVEKGETESEMKSRKITGLSGEVVKIGDFKFSKLTVLDGFSLQKQAKKKKKKKPDVSAKFSKLSRLEENLLVDSTAFFHPYTPLFLAASTNVGLLNEQACWPGRNMHAPGKEESRTNNSSQHSPTLLISTKDKTALFQDDPQEDPESEEFSESDFDNSDAANEYLIHGEVKDEDLFDLDESSNSDEDFLADFARVSLLRSNSRNSFSNIGRRNKVQPRKTRKMSITSRIPIVNAGTANAIISENITTERDLNKDVQHVDLDDAHSSDSDNDSTDPESKRLAKIRISKTDDYRHSERLQNTALSHLLKKFRIDSKEMNKIRLRPEKVKSSNENMKIARKYLPLFRITK